MVTTPSIYSPNIILSVDSITILEVTDIPPLLWQCGPIPQSYETKPITGAIFCSLFLIQEVCSQKSMNLGPLVCLSTPISYALLGLGLRSLFKKWIVYSLITSTKKLLIKLDMVDYTVIFLSHNQGPQILSFFFCLYFSSSVITFCVFFYCTLGSVFDALHLNTNLCL